LKASIMARRNTDPKASALRQCGCLHPSPEKVSDDLFTTNEFFDPRDLLQVKYEMLRRVREGDHSISQAAANFGLSRPSFYQAQAAYEAGGLPALLPKKPGPRRAHKLSEEIVEALRQMQDQASDMNTSALAEQVRERFGVSVHPRSIERALARQEKKRRP
jgi:transposase